MAKRRLLIGCGATLLSLLLLLPVLSFWLGDGCQTRDCPGLKLDAPPRRAGHPIPAGGALALGLGGNKSCAIMRDHLVFCWGSDEQDPLSSNPELLNDALNNGRYHGPGYGCQLSKEQVNCWDEGRDLPAPAGDDFVELWVGSRSGCAKHRRGAVECWGRGEPWARKNETLSPTRYAGLHDIDDLMISEAWVSLRRGQTVARVRGADLDELKEAAGEADFVSSAVLKCANVSCAREKQGQIECWSEAAHSLDEPTPFGFSGSLQVSNGKLCELTPRGASVCLSCDELLKAPPVQGPVSECKVEASGTVLCAGAVVPEGNGLVTRTAPARRLAGVTGALRVIDDAHQVCVEQEDKGWSCRPLLSEGAPTRQTGNGWQVPSGPRVVAEAAASTGVSVNRLAMCFTDATANVRCYRRTPLGTLRSPPAVDLPNVHQIAVGSSHACALGQDGGLKCWGANESGQALGKPEPALVDAPTLVLSDVAEVAVGLRHTCAATHDGRVVCFGDNHLGQLGPGPADASGMVEVRGAPAAPKQLVAGFQATCALTGAGDVVCWGATNNEQVPRPAYQVSGLGGAVLQLAAGGDRVCALLAAHSVSCWQGNQAPPVAVPGTEGSLEVAVGDEHGCVRNGDGRVRCWGSNELGQAGAEVRANRTEIQPPHSCPQVTYDVQSQLDSAQDVSW